MSRRLIAGKAFALAPFLLFILFAAVSFPHASRQLAQIRDTVQKDSARLLSTDRDGRLVETYGDREIMGFGYLRDVLKGIPDPKFFPKTRYHYYSMNEYVVFPNLYTRISDKMLVGIDLKSEDLKEAEIGNAVRISAEKGPDKTLSGWGFVTQWEYDRLSALRVSFEKAPQGPIEVYAVILNSQHDPRPLGEWRWTLEAAGISELLRFEKPLKNLYGRGSLPYVLFLETRQVSGGSGPEISSVEVLGTKVSLEGYTPFHLESSCFAALETHFFVEILRNKDIAWLDYLLAVSNVPEVRQAAGTAKRAASGS